MTRPIPTMAGVAAREAAGKAAPWEIGPRMEPGDFEAIRRSLILDHHKWDPQVGDIDVLVPYPILMGESVWERLCEAAEALTEELLAAERAIWGSPALIARLGLPAPLERVLARSGDRAPTPALARVMRFDFHFTTRGWLISEVNSDVPGGYTEAGPFAELVSRLYPGTSPAGDPGGECARAILRRLGPESVIAAISAPGHMEDHQVVGHVGRLLARAGCRVHLGDPSRIRWAGERAHLAMATDPIPLDGIFRFFQGEWFPNLPRGGGWEHYFTGGATPVMNPGIALLTESKRLPLLVDELPTPTGALRRYFPKAFDPRDADWKGDEALVLKSAYCNNGDTVACAAWPDRKGRDETMRQAERRPGEWVVQERFEPVWFDTPEGRSQACIGVYTVNGRRAGAYARLTDRPFIDFAARDAALLTRPDHE